MCLFARCWTRSQLLSPALYTIDCRGPKRYDFDADASTWIYSHDSVPLHERLTKEISEILGEATHIVVPVDAE